MDIILLENIENLGSLGDKVAVKSGYARNYLVPHGKAQMATPANLEAFEARRADLEKAAQTSKAAAEVRKQALEALGVTEITAKVGTEGKLFGSIGPSDIADAVTAKGCELNKAEIRMPDGPLRHTGEEQIDVHLHSDVDAVVTISVIGED
jgi:large subunit ribosomal protein L9